MNLFLANRFAYRILNVICRILEKSKIIKRAFRPLINYWREIKGLRIIDEQFIRYVKLKEKGLEMHKEQIESVAFRGSGADYDYYPDSHSYNLGLTSGDLYNAYWLYANNLKGCSNLKNCILFYSVSCCGLELIKTVEKYRQVVYSTIFAYNLPNDSGLDARNVETIRKRVEEIGEINCENSYYGYEKEQYFMATPADERIKSHLRENRREPDQLIWLKKLADEIDRNRQHLYIVLPPYRSDYRKLLPEKEIIYEKLFSIHFPKSTTIVDFHDAKDFDDSDFGDTDHMNEQGAKKLTRELNNIINKGT